MSDQPRPSSRVSLEDLLRLKRAERPPAEFWAEFEQSLRAKQLAAIVDKRPWWRSWPSLSRWSVPLGAAAALTLTVTIISRAPTKASLASPKGVSGPVASEVVPPTSPAVAVVETPSVIQPVTSSVPAPRAATEKPSAIEVASSELPAVEPRVQPAPSVAPAEVRTPSAQLVSVSEQVAGLGVNGETDQAAPARYTAVAHKDSAAVRELNTFFERAVAHLDPGIRTEKSLSIEPLAQIQSPRDARRARLLAYTGAVDTHSPQYSDNSNVIRSRERITSHLSDEALYDSIRRLGLKNGGVSIQF